MFGSIRGEVHYDWLAIQVLDAQRLIDGANRLRSNDDIAVSFHILL